MSPIRGLTDVITPRLPTLGKLRKGGVQIEKNGKKVVGPDLEYFRFTSERADVLSAFQSVYGEKPVALHVYLPYASVHDNFGTWKEKWVAGGMSHRCDGKTCTIWLTPEGKYSQEPKPCPGGCDEVGRLALILPDLVRAGFVGLVTMETHSINDILNVSACLAAVSEARAKGSLGLRGVEFVLRRKPEHISTPGFGDDKTKRQRVEKWLVVIEPVPSWAETALLLASAPVAEALEAPESPDEGGDAGDAEEGKIVESTMVGLAASPLDTVIARLRATAAANDKVAQNAPLQDKHKAVAWGALKLLPFTDLALGELLIELFGSPDFTTRGQAAAVYHWLTPQGGTVLDLDGAVEAEALMQRQAQRLAEDEFAELGERDEP